MRSKVVTKEEALAKIKDGQTIMFGDWHGQITADELIDGVLEKGVKDIAAIAVSAGTPDQGVGKLIAAHRVKSLATTHIAFNPLARDQMFAGELDIEFVPQGTFAERIRCGGAGLGGCLTPTGIGTEVEEGKQKLTINGKECLGITNACRRSLNQSMEGRYCGQYRFPHDQPRHQQLYGFCRRYSYRGSPGTGGSRRT